MVVLCIVIAFFPLTTHLPGARLWSTGFRFVGVCSFQLLVGRFGILFRHKAVFPSNCGATVCCQVADLNYIEEQFGTL
jgi:hypothetical protein